MKYKAKDMVNSCILILTIIFLLRTIFYYNVLYDLFLIILLLVSSFSLGVFFHVHGDLIEAFVMRTALGLGIEGMAIYFALLFGIGSKSVYLLIVLMPIILGAYRYHNATNECIYQYRISFKSVVCANRLLMAVLIFLFSLYVMYGSFPMSKYDTLTKHLPITQYAVENGEWYTNVTESIVYGEPMVLQYTYSTFFASLGAYKALVLFNIVMLFFVYVILGYFIKRIYPNGNLFIFAIMLLTTPFFFEFATAFYLEILPLFFCFSAFIGTADLDKEKIWHNMEAISLLAGMSLFVKLTHLFTLMCMMFVLAMICIIKAIHEKKIAEIVYKAIKCFALVIVPSITSLINIFIRTGNPFFPSYNGFFKSPFFGSYNFADPMKNRLTFSIRSLIDIVFNTSMNIEMGAFGMGVFLLFIFCVPISGIIFLREKKYTYIIWSLVGILAFLANTLTTYNLRYYSAVWVMLMCIITISISRLVAVFKCNKFRRVIYVIIAIILLQPNVQYILDESDFEYKIQKNESVVSNSYCAFFDDIPEHKKVLSITNSNQFKGQYKGYFASTTWHNSTINRIRSGDYSWKEYASSFDYILVDKFAGKILVEPNIMNIIEPVLEDKIEENDACILYSVKHIASNVFRKEYIEGQNSKIAEPVCENFDNEYAKYSISETVINKEEERISVRFQINWVDENGRILDAYIRLYEAEPGECMYNSDWIPAENDAKYGIVYVVPAKETDTIEVKSLELEGTKDITLEEKKRYESWKFFRSILQWAE